MGSYFNPNHETSGQGDLFPNSFPAIGDETSLCVSGIATTQNALIKHSLISADSGASASQRDQFSVSEASYCSEELESKSDCVVEVNDSQFLEHLEKEEN